MLTEIVLSMKCSWYSRLMQITFGGEANVKLSGLVRRANHVDFACDTYKCPSINDITIHKIMVWYMES